MTMCSSSDVLDALRAAGVTVTVEGGRLVLTPGAKVPPELKPIIREHKAEIVRALTPGPSRTPWEVAARTLAGMEPCSEAEADYIHRLESEGWSRQALTELLNADTSGRWSR